MGRPEARSGRRVSSLPFGVLPGPPASGHSCLLGLVPPPREREGPRCPAGGEPRTRRNRVGLLQLFCLITERCGPRVCAPSTPEFSLVLSSLLAFCLCAGGSPAFICSPDRCHGLELPTASPTDVSRHLKRLGLHQANPSLTCPILGRFSLPKMWAGPAPLVTGHLSAVPSEY
ncbi:hypothetical protein J1605_020516 [Eschrichtius robustus]|uniref:Uncharacterized protein n=1 Tax=Eschrichtius robustus TaxID=9764 RepID=A0AB34HMQ5_ESCRO|nr:hypothetical protein J1605_020516 [Eschrichtius robustus]